MDVGKRVLTVEGHNDKFYITFSDKTVLCISLEYITVHGKNVPAVVVKHCGHIVYTSVDYLQSKP